MDGQELLPEPVEIVGVQRDDRRARRELAAAMLAFAATGELPLGRTLQTPGEIAIAFLLGCHAATTRDAYARDLAHWFVWLDRQAVLPLAVSRVAIDRYQQSLDGAQPTTVRRRLACLSGFYEYAREEGAIDKNPVARVARPRVPDTVSTLGLSKPRARQLIRAARTTGPRELLLVLLLLHLGLRVSEAVGADIADIAEEQGHPILRIRGKGQGAKSARVPLNAAVHAAVTAAQADRDAGPLLLSPRGSRMTRQYAGKTIKQIGVQIGQPQLHPHALRHTFVTLSLNEGVSLRDVQDAARHADPRTTRRYDRDRHSLARHPTHRLLGALEG